MVLLESGVLLKSTITAEAVLVGTPESERKEESSLIRAGGLYLT